MALLAKLLPFPLSNDERVQARPSCDLPDYEHSSFSRPSTHRLTLVEPSLLPVPHSQDEENFDVQYRQKITGNIPANSNGNIPAFNIAHRDYLKLVQGAMREDVGFRPGAAKVLAEKLKCSDKTAQSWLEGKTAPSGILDLRAMNKIPAYAALKREIAAMEIGIDPRLQAKYQELHALTLALAGGADH